MQHVYAITRNQSCIALLITVFCINQLWSQCNPDPLPGFQCSESAPLCFTAQCYTTQNNPPDEPHVNWCGPNTAIHNPQYFVFVADDSLLHLEIDVNMCDGGGCGLQSAILDACPWDNTNVVACNPGTPPGGTMILTYSSAIPGNPYWLVIDGCGGQVCEYTFPIINGVALSPQIVIDTVICAEVLEYEGVEYTPGTHLIRYENLEGCDSLVTLNVQAQLEVSLDPIVVCFPNTDTILVSPHVSGIGTNFSFEWYDGSTDSIFTLIAPDPDELISVTVTDEDGCSAEALLVIQNEIHILLDMQEEYNCNEHTYDIDLDISISGGVAPYIITLVNVADTSTKIQNLFDVAPGTYRVRAVDQNECVAESFFVLADIEPIDVSILPAEPEVCQFSSLELNALVTGGSGPFTYEWFTETGFSDSSSVVVSGQDTVVLIVRDQYACVSVEEVVVNEKPAPQFSLGEDASYCPHILANGIPINIPDDPGLALFQFTPNWGMPPYQVTQPGAYGLTVTDVFGCSASDEIQIAYAEQVNAAFTSFVTGTTVTFVSTTTAGSFVYWDFGDGTTDTVFTVVHDYAVVDTFEVTLIAIGNCGSDTASHTIVTSATSQPVNNACAGATDLGLILSRDIDCQQQMQPLFQCTFGTNLYADQIQPPALCGGINDPGVWYTFETDEDAAILNITLTSDVIDVPLVQLFTGSCGDLEGPIPITGNALPCLAGSGGSLQLSGTPVSPSTTYYLAISSVNGAGGLFDLCLNILRASPQPCVTDTEIRIVQRSRGGSLAGPFYPGEEITICLEVLNFQVSTGAQSCQWFQGIVPVFGNAWDPGSFDTFGQPHNATMNEASFPAHNVHNDGTWEWWTEVRYHHPYCHYNVMDADDNGTLDMCHDLYSPDCHGDGLAGGCCGPCWNSTDPGNTGDGSLLPPGWFTSGVDGSCGGLSGWPTVDWGDGNTCSGPTGPWRFCFDLKVHESPEELVNPNLSIGFFTFADGEVGSWTGGVSVCANDIPTQLRLPLCTTPGVPPVAQFEYMTDAPEVVFQNTSQGASAFYWSFGDGTNSTEQHPVHAFLVSGTYVVEMIAYGHCSSDTVSQEIIVTGTAVHQIDLENNLRLYPNPSTGSFTILSDIALKAAQIQIYDQFGRHIGFRQQGMNVFELQTQRPGIYSIVVRDIRGMHIGRIVIQ